MKKNNIIFFLTGIYFFLGCQSKSNHLESGEEINQSVKYDLNLVSFSEEYEHLEFFEYNLAPIDSIEAVEDEFGINFIGEESQKAYFYFGASTVYKAFILDESFHWVPTSSNLTVSLDTSYFDFLLKSTAYFSAYTSKDHWSRKSMSNEKPIVNKIEVSSHVSITNTTFISEPKITQNENGTETHWGSVAQSPGDIYGFSIKNNLECDTLVIQDFLSGGDSFLKFLNEIYQPGEQIIMEKSR